MKKFSLDEYLKNPSRKIVTRDGHNARIISTDRKSPTGHNIVVLLDYGSEEIPANCNDKGEHDFCSPFQSKGDLFFVPEKKEGWIKVYYGKSRCNTFVCNRIFATKEEAEKQKNDDVVAIIKIEWEE